jgi:hypothetical protein
VPVEFRSDEDAARFGRYDGPPSWGELERAFFLDDADRALVGRRRGPERAGRVLVLAPGMPGGLRELRDTNMPDDEDD